MGLNKWLLKFPPLTLGERQVLSRSRNHAFLRPKRSWGFGCCGPWRTVAHLK